MNTHFLHDRRQTLTDACNKDFVALVQLRGTFSTKNNAMNTHFLHDRRKVSLCETKSSVTKELFAKLCLFYFFIRITLVLL
jgi:hypothetical protein